MILNITSFYSFVVLRNHQNPLMSCYTVVLESEGINTSTQLCMKS